MVVININKGKKLKKEIINKNVNNCECSHLNGFSPWVFVTYNCSCACPYCMVPKIGNNNMTSETFEKMLNISEKLIENKIYDVVYFRLSGGEPFLVWKNYADLVTKYKEKYKHKMNFGMLSNLTIFNDEIAEWMKKNNMGIQVSLDDIDISKPLHNGESSAPIVIKNIELLRKYEINFSLNTVLNYKNTKSLTKLIDYICSINPYPDWGLSASYTLDDDSHLSEIINILKLAILQLRDNNYNILNKLRFYNEILNEGGRCCNAGNGIFALGTNLEVWSCQSLIDKNPIGYFDENIKELLETSERNKYFFNRSLMPCCTNCNILHWCRGGCRAVNLTNTKASEVTCKIKQKLIPFILQETQNYVEHKHHHVNNLESIINDFVQNQVANETQKEVETIDLKRVLENKNLLL